jgi:sulfite reductase (NADPH) flavoprotein alpha-component
MNQITPPPKIEIIPSSAPFSEAQRSWLNGFFAGLLSDAPTPLSAEQGAAVMQGPAGDGDDGEAPWHEQTMPIACRRTSATAAHDGGHGAAGLRPVRLQLP